MTDTEETPNLGGKPLAFPTVESLQTAIDAYFKQCDDSMLEGATERYKPYTMSGLAVALGVDRNTILNYGKKDEYFRTVKEARARIEGFAEEKLYSSNVAGVIFNLKNNFGWKDKTEQELLGSVNITKVERVFVDPNH